MRYEEPIESVANRLKYAMSVRGISQSELCKKTGISAGSLSQYASNYVVPKQNRIYVIAKALSVDESWLMGYDVPMDRKVVSKQERENDFMSDSDVKYIVEMYTKLDSTHKMMFKNMLEALVK